MLINFVVVFAISSSWTDKADESQEVEWIEEIPDDSTEVVQEVATQTETFPDIKFQPIETPQEKKPTTESKTEGEKEKSSDDSVGKLKVLSKVLPRDVVAELMSGGTISEGRVLKAGKVVLTDYDWHGEQQK